MSDKVLANMETPTGKSSSRRMTGLGVECAHQQRELGLSRGGVSCQFFQLRNFQLR